MSCAEGEAAKIRWEDPTQRLKYSAYCVRRKSQLRNLNNSVIFLAAVVGKEAVFLVQFLAPVDICCTLVGVTREKEKTEKIIGIKRR